MQYSKHERQEAIKRTILNGKIHSQEDLKKALVEQGISISQATLSRDLQEMGVVKSHGTSVSYYSIQEGRYGAINSNSSVIGLEVSGNMAVVRTLPGHASMLASLIDRKELKEIAGTIAGDDTIFMVLRQEVTPDQVYRSLSSIFPNLI